MSKTQKKSKTGRYAAVVIAGLALAVVAGYLGSGLRSDSAAASGGSESGAWLEKIKESGELRIGMAPNPPMISAQADGTMGGPNILPLERLADEMGVTVVTVPSNDANRVPGLLADRYDVVANLDATSERSLSIRFTDAVYSYPGVFIVRADSGLATAQDIIGAGRVAVAQGTAYEPNIEDLGVEVIASDDTPKAISAMKAGRADAVFSDLPTLADAAQKDPELKVVIPEETIYQSTANYGVAPTIDDRSLDVLNIAIRTSINDGSLARAFKEAGVINEDTIGDLAMRK